VYLVENRENGSIEKQDLAGIELYKEIYKKGALDV
jgi:hypothetical protein